MMQALQLKKQKGDLRATIFIFFTKGDTDTKISDLHNHKCLILFNFSCCLMLQC